MTDLVLHGSTLRAGRPDHDGAARGAVAPDVLHQACVWFATLQSGAATRDEEDACLAWRQADVEHQRAWEQLSDMGRYLRHTAERVGPLAAASVLSAEKRVCQRRRVLKAAAVFVPLVVGSEMLNLSGRALSAERHQTGVGEQRSLVLADGTRLRLNTRTEIEVACNASQRRIRLLDGELMIDTRSAEPIPPIWIETADGAVQSAAKGVPTRFSVRRLEDLAASTQVGVHAGDVLLTCREGMSQPLRAGEQCTFTRQATGTVEPLDLQTHAWMGGVLVAVRRPLGGFLADLGRYRPGRLGWDANVADLRLTGTFPIADTDQILAALQDSLPVRVDTRTRYWVTVRAA
ncbi:DUF4880 domain-containing protein [Pigmentiphaga aceris]|uniref:DUF4880 domain-containing protein n=1 Tax=Pigmentiphaga aceris TaxID=1940612 RepID=A0A5C0B3U5_9BURK|nr:FecR domain-containing protein [Pigmentiphaga aceris]QEI08915.1 DUF4880 domain-containing protein [Pigmentiphaga aceris]